MGRRSNAEGFGFVPMETAHHFLVTLPSAPKEKVLVSEHFALTETEEKRELNFALGKEDSNLRVVLERFKWEGIAHAAQAEFNERLKKMGLKLGQWKPGRVPLSRLFGKELVLLGWAIEDADPALIPAAIKNWLGLMPEERWWLYTMTNAATGHAVYGRNRGWRKAVRYALTENPVSDHAAVERVSSSRSWKRRCTASIRRESMKSDTLTFIRSCIRERRIFWTYHVNMRLQGRYIAREQILAAVDTFDIIEEYPEDKYLPSCLVWAKAGNDIIHIHIALDREGDNVRIITAYKPSADKWTADLKKRRKK